MDKEEKIEIISAIIDLVEWDWGTEEFEQAKEILEEAKERIERG